MRIAVDDAAGDSAARRWRDVGQGARELKRERVGTEYWRVVDFGDGDGDRRRIGAQTAVARDELELIGPVVVGAGRVDESRRRAGQGAVSRRGDNGKRDRRSLGISPCQLDLERV